MSGRIDTFRDLEVYQLGFDLAMRLFDISKRFPAEERFELVSQIRRSSRSVCANTAEAWPRRRYPAAFVAKITDAEAEAAETRVHLDVALHCGYIDRPLHRDLDRAYDTLTAKPAPVSSRGGSPEAAP